MRLKLIGVVFSLVATAGLSFPPAGAIDLGCSADVDGDGSGATALVLAPAAAAEATNWSPDCVTISNLGIVTWTNTEALPHQPQADGCFKGARIGAAGSTSAQFYLAPNEDTGDLELTSYVGGVGTVCDLGAKVEREGSFPGDTFQGEKLPVVEIAADGSGATIWYICGIHGASMVGRIIVTI